MTDEAQAPEPSLLDKLRGLGAKIDSSLQPSLNEVPALLAALIHHSEHGDDLFDPELSRQDVANKVTGVSEEDAAAAQEAAAGTGAPGAPAGQDPRIAELQAEVQSLRIAAAAGQHPVVEHTPADPVGSAEGSSLGASPTARDTSSTPTVVGSPGGEGAPVVVGPTSPPEQV